MTDAFRFSRRKFLWRTGLAAGAGVTRSDGASVEGGVSIVMSADDHVASAPPVKWAASELERFLVARGISVHHHQRVGEAVANDICIVVTSGDRASAREITTGAKAALPTAPEAFAFVPGKAAGSAVLLATSTGARGLIYALLEIADRIEHAERPLAALDLRQSVIEKPANPVRSVNRCYQSDAQDKPWY